MSAIEQKKEFIDLIEKHQGIIYKVSKMYCDKDECRQDLFQDILVQLWQSYPTFNQKSKFSTWLYRIAYNAAISKTRKKGLKTADLEDEVIHNYSEDTFGEDLTQLSGEAQQRMLNKALSGLSGDEDLLITLYYKNENSVEEISGITGLTESNVKVKLHRIRKKLYEKMNLLMQSNVKKV